METIEEIIEIFKNMTSHQRQKLLNGLAYELNLKEVRALRAVLYCLD